MINSLPGRNTTSPEQPGEEIEVVSESERERVPHFSDSQFQELFDCAPSAVVCFDRDYNFIYANQPAIHLTGSVPLLGRCLWKVFPGNLEEPFYSNYKSTMEQRVETEFEAFYPEPLNLWFKVRARPIEAGLAVFFTEISDRKRAEARQRHMARRLQQVFDVTTDAIITIDRDWRITFVNRRAGEILAVKEDLLGKNLWEEFPASADPKGPYFEAYQRAMRNGVASEFEAYYPAPLDAYFSLEARPTEDGIVLFFRDITERRAWEQAIEAQQSLLASVQQGAMIATWSLNPATGRIDYGHGSYPVFGHPLEAVSTLPQLLEVIKPEDRERVLATTRGAVRDRTMFTVDFEVMAEQGGRVCVECRGQASETGDQMLRISGIAVDISARKRADAALLVQQQANERQRTELETIYQTAEIGLALFSSDDFRYLRLNERQAELVGLPAEEIIGRTLTEIAPDVPGLQEIFEGVRNGAPVRDLILEGELPARPGEPRVWSVSYTPVYGQDGSVVAITAASLEITQQKRAEAALLHSEKLAAVGRLASSISHEINNPLEAVTNLLYLIGMEENLPEDVKGYLATAQAELSRVSQIATQTLRFHRQASKPAEVTAEELVEDVLDLYQGRLFNSGIRVERKYASATPMLCFENDLRQVLNNLIANAIDAMEGGGRIVVRAHEAYEAGKCRVRITIADTGHGMSKATAARIFDPFFTTKDLNGTGLGLWISAEIVARHHGRLRVRSSKSGKHRGTVFTLVLPCDEAPEEAANPSAYSVAGSS